MRDIPENEITRWANILIEPDFIDKHIIVEQVRKSRMYIKESYIDACFAGFRVIGDIKRYPHNVTVPVEMTIYRKNGMPIDFLLFLSEGVVHEMEIADYDLLELDPLHFDFSRREYRVNEALMI